MRRSGRKALERIVDALRRRVPQLPLAGIAGIDASNAAAVIGAGATASPLSRRCRLRPIRPPPRARSVASWMRCWQSEAPDERSGRRDHRQPDLGGGAGVQADLKTFSALGVYGASVITALTAQNTRGVVAVHEVPADFITAQIDAVFSDFDVAAVKIGMLGNAAAADAVAAGLDRHRARNVVLDPVLAATSGETLLRADAIGALRKLAAARAC